MTSIRLRLINWCRSLGYQAAQHVAHKLSSHDIHSQSSGDVNDRRVLRIYCDGAKRQPDNAVGDPVLCDKIDKYHASLCVTNLPIAAVNARNPTGLNDHFVVTHNHPLLAELNARSSGTRKESSDAKI